MCYTSGTTGNPKGVRLFAPLERAARADGEHLRHERLFVARRGDAGRADVPRQLLGDRVRRSDRRRLAWSCRARSSTARRSIELLDRYKVTCTAAVPTVWLMLLQHLEATGSKLPHLRKVVIGGSACPRAMTKTFQDDYGVEVIHAWGMTEMSPLGTAVHAQAGICRARRRCAARHPAEAGSFAVRGRDEDHRRCRQAAALGRQDLRPPQGARAGGRARLLQGGRRRILDEEGFFDTGDVATIDRHGYMQITDRAKDVIKSGGEWISSIDLENLAVGHPKVAEAAVIGVKHPKWDERPLLVIVLKKDQTATTGGDSCASCRARSRAGGCRTRSFSSMRFRIRRPAKSRRPCCGSGSRISSCPVPSPRSNQACGSRPIGHFLRSSGRRWNFFQSPCAAGRADVHAVIP